MTATSCIISRDFFLIFSWRLYHIRVKIYLEFARNFQDILFNLGCFVSRVCFVEVVYEKTEEGSLQW